MNRSTVKDFVITIVLSVFSLTVTAQTYKGRIVGESGQPLNSASIIMLADDNHTTLNFTRCRQDGTFSISETEGKKAGSIMFSCIGYVRDTISIKDFCQGQTIVLHEQAVVIKEVKVKAPRVTQRGDTLNFLVKSFRQKQDRSIADVIKKMPGLQVGSDGSIYYQGRQINKFYIEGLDLMGRKYAIASENLSADKVKSVQVLENHQQVNMLRDVSFSEQAALNIVLTEDARNVWQGMADIGGGTTVQGNADMLGDCRLTAMMFSRKMQSISMYKYNNTGKNVMKEVTDKQTLDNGVPTELSMLDDITMPVPSLEPARTTFNDSHLLATNWLFKTHKGDDLRLQISGLLDKTIQDQYTQTVYTDIGDGSTMVEDVDADKRTSELSAELLYRINRDDIYLENTVKGFADFNKSSAVTMLNGHGLYENVKPRKRYVADTFTISKRLKSGRLFSLSAYFSYNNLPGSLLLTDSTAQKLDMQSFYWGAETFFGHRVGVFDFRYTLSAKGKSQQLSVHNTGFSGKDSYSENDTRLAPQISYKDGSMNFTASVPLVWLVRTLNGDTHNKFLMEPSLRLGFHPAARWDFSASYSYSCTPLDVSSSGRLPIFIDYITMRQGRGSLCSTKSHAVSGSLSYKNTVKGQFATVAVTWSKVLDNILYSSELTGDVYKSYATDRTSDSKMLSVFARLAQSFRWSKLNIGMTAYYVNNDYSLLVSGDLMPFRMDNLILSADISLQPAHWLSFEAYSSFTMSGQENKGKSNFDIPALNSFSHGIKCFLMPGHWQIEFDNELYHSNDESVSFNYFSDISVSYRRKTYEIGVSLNNIFGNNTYSKHTISTTMRCYQVTKLRPRVIIAKVSFNF